MREIFDFLLLVFAFILFEIILFFLRREWKKHLKKPSILEELEQGDKDFQF